MDRQLPYLEMYLLRSGHLMTDLLVIADLVQTLVGVVGSLSACSACSSHCCARPLKLTTALCMMQCVHDMLSRKISSLSHHAFQSSHFATVLSDHRNQRMISFCRTVLGTFLP